MPINEYLLQRRLQELAPINPFVPVATATEEQPTYAAPQAPMPRAIAPTETEQRMADLAATRPSLEEGQPGYKQEYAHPGKLNRLAAILTGLSTGIRRGGAEGYQAGRAVRLAPYQMATEEWEGKRKALEPLMESELKRQQLGVQQFGTEADIYGAELRRMSYNQLNTLRDRHNRELEDLERQKLTARNAEEQGKNDRLIKQHEQMIQRIDRQLAGQKDIAGRQIESREKVAKIGATSREKVAGMREAGATSRSKERIAAAGSRQGSPFAKVTEQQAEANAAMKLVRSNPQWEEFINVEDTARGSVVKFKSASEFSGTSDEAKIKRDQFKLFSSAVAREMEKMKGSQQVGGISYEYLDEDQEDQDMNEEE